MQIEIIHQDDYCLLVNKPNNVLVHHAFHSRNKINEESLLQLLDNQLKRKFYPVHRLDRKTSGVILLATKKEYVAKFQALFRGNHIKKTYYGVVRGFTKDQMLINSPVKGRDATIYKEAETHLKLLDKITIDIPVKPYITSRYTLVQLSPKTGRMHQLRIHMNKISHPLINDAKYGDKNHDLMYEKRFGWKNLFLHAGSLEFIHPFTNKKIFAKGNFSQDWIQLFQKFSWKDPLF
ncbi:MAG: tRNA pseudouridine synthase C [Flavobacterium sp. SCGC AAA160-P02]|nr:MAG: tRNA pseudouridine synthase C [Flavobacterium sp. SCGC AAA160-P02]